MSYRSTLTDGNQIYGDGGDGSPTELDPLGGNVGLSTPYYEIEQPPIEPEYPSLRNLHDESPMYVDGMRVTATLDGMAVPVSFALNALNNGSAIPASIAWAQNLPGFSFENMGLGIFRTTIPWDIYRNETVLKRVFALECFWLFEECKMLARNFNFENVYSFNTSYIKKSTIPYWIVECLAGEKEPSSYNIHYWCKVVKLGKLSKHLQVY